MTKVGACYGARLLAEGVLTSLKDTIITTSKTVIKAAKKSQILVCARSSAGSGRYHRVERSGSARAGVPTERQKSDLKTNNLCGGWISGALQINKKGDSCTWNSEKMIR